MKFRALNIETLRQSPSNSRTEGFALLVRANYVTRENRLTELGKHALAHLKEMSRVDADTFMNRLGLVTLRAEDETFFAITTGTVTLLRCPLCNYTARQEIAQLEKRVFSSESESTLEKVATPDCSTIESLALFLGIPKQKTAKALMFTRISDGKFIFGALRGDLQLSEAKFKRVSGEIRIASPEELAQAGAVAGYASPVGLKNAIIIVDDLIPRSPNLVIGANEFGYHLKNSNFGRDYSADVVADIVLAKSGDPCPQCGTSLVALSAELLADEGGYRFENILPALAEGHHDDKGLMFPSGVSAFDVYLMDIPAGEMNTGPEAEKIYALLQDAGITVLFDDRSERAGIKFNDADLIGCPIRVSVGEKNLKDGMVELKPRMSTQNQLVPISNLIGSIQSLLETLK
jgi:prolyl-tRNA synthetase